MFVYMYVYVCVYVCVEESESVCDRNRMSEKRNEMKRNETSVGIVRDIAII